ncbi:MAG TPA: hypothetical protein VK249_34375 [Anaerolineales bacterium]|nr:hypothetical protein [Anaerolineales bacterium]
MNRKWKKRIFALATIVFVMLFATTSTVLAKSRTAKSPLDPGNFVKKIDNPYFPLKPGTTFTYRGETEGSPTRDVMTVTNKTKVILDITTTVVHDRVFEDGVLVEDTFDWYAQDKKGNVWYFGEDTKELDENGNVISTEGSWEAGVDGAKPGIIMEAHPKKGDKYRQEFAPDVAEDMAKVIGFKASLCVPYGCFKHVLITKEWTPLEPGVVENKYYAKGVGFIFGVTVKGGDEQIELVRVRH